VETAVRTVLLCLLIAALSAAANPYAFPMPDDAKVVDVQKDFGAKGDGITDDTEAIRNAIKASIDRDRYRAMAIVYLRKGTYLVSGPIEGRNGTTGWSAGWRSGMQLWGESREGTVIRLKDGCDGYGDVKNPKWVVACGSEFDEKVDKRQGGGNRAFRHNLVNFTLDVGNGNPGAVGIDYVCNNRGTVEEVTVRAGKDSGWCGLRMERAWPGPALVRSVRIEGFAIGMRVDHYQYGMTFSHLDLSGQRECAIVNGPNTLFIEDLRYQGSAPLLRGTSDQGSVTLIGAAITGTAATGPAFSAMGSLAIRNLSSSGFATVIAAGKSGAEVATDPAKPFALATYSRGQVAAMDGGEAKPLLLPIEEAPIYLPKGAADLVSGASGLQAALDSGTPVVYLPQGHYPTTETLVIRRGTRRIIGLCASITAPKGKKVEPLIRFEGGAGEAVSIEHICVGGVLEHAGAGSLALLHGDHDGYHATGIGKSFISDVIGRDYQIAVGHRLWARQLNAEFGPAPLIVNRGTLWMLGFKTEKGEPDWTCLVNHGGSVEVLGANLYALRKPPDGAVCFVNDGGRMALSFSPNGDRYPVWLRTRPQAGEGPWTDFTQKQVQGRGPALLTVGAAAP